MNLKGKSFLKLLDFTKEEIQYLLDLAVKLKRDKKNKIEQKTMKRHLREQDAHLKLLHSIKVQM
mgnify:CR=1 FL=1